jgi:ribosomal protein S18 acetylase RimI-like enzyme
MCSDSRPQRGQPPFSVTILLMSPKIRQYQAADYEEVKRCFIELQEFERSIEPIRVLGKDMAAQYLEYLFAKCAEYTGAILVATVSGSVVGFVCIWPAVTPTESEVIVNGASPYAYISDLVVLSSHRGRGIGRRLLQEAERFASERGATTLRIGVLANNRNARDLCVNTGFSEHEILLWKRLKP